ncbi:MAG: WbqC family protein [Bacteroidales bacterium]|nr:WbqC family protein [Bacteroidales bacterium]
MTAVPHFGVSVLTTAYLPPVEYFYAIAHSDRVLIEQHEAYQKQSWRNRCRILATAGPEDLSIPVVKEERLSRPIRDIRIDYGEPWLQHHIRAFSAAYNHSAFYDYYADDLIPLLERKPVFLFDLNMSLLEKLMALLGLDVPVSLTDFFVTDYSSVEEKNVSLPRRQNLQGSRHLALKNRTFSTRPPRDVFFFDGRERIQPKYKGESLLAEYGSEQAYYQVFVNRDPSRESFIPNLSIIDLLSAEGPNAGAFLRI